MHADVPNHEPSLLLMNCGDARLIRPSLGSWVTYGLGTENQNLPGFIAMCPGGYPDPGVAELAVRLPARRLPGHVHRHPAHRHREADREHPQRPRRRRRAAPAARPAAAAQRAPPASAAATTPQLEARIQSFELAYRMQTRGGRRLRRQPRAASTSATCTAPASQARQLLIARRLLERGVRFVQVWHGDGPAVGQPRRPRSQPPPAGRASATRPIAALLTDLKQRGLLDETLVIWGGEFGRTPTVELPTAGRQRRQDQRPRPQPLRLHDVAGRRRRQGRPRPRRHRRVRLPGRREHGPRPRPARHDPAPARLRPRDASPTATPAATSA